MANKSSTSLKDIKISLPGRKSKSSSRGRMPVKKTINLAQVGLEKLNVPAAILAIVVLTALAFLVGKIGIADRLIAVDHAQARVTQLQNQLDALYEEYAQYGDIEEEYAHYTYAGMTEEELTRVSRTDIITMIEDEFIIGDTLTSWSVSGSTLTLTVQGKTLQDINLLARQLETYDMVNVCAVTNAKTVNVTVVDSVTVNPDTGREVTNSHTESAVRANVIVYLQNVEEVEVE